MAVAPDLVHVRRFLEAGRGLCTISVARADGSVSSSLVNGGLLAHPLDGSTVLGIVVRGTAYKLRRLRVEPRATVSVAQGWEWQAVEGPVDLIGPDDVPAAGTTLDVAALLRQVYSAAGGTHDDWPAFDRAMASERRAAVLLRPQRVYGVTSSGQG